MTALRERSSHIYSCLSGNNNVWTRLGNTFAALERSQATLTKVGENVISANDAKLDTTLVSAMRDSLIPANDFPSLEAAFHRDTARAAELFPEGSPERAAFKKIDTIPAALFGNNLFTARTLGAIERHNQALGRNPSGLTALPDHVQESVSAAIAQAETTARAAEAAVDGIRDVVAASEPDKTSWAGRDTKPAKTRAQNRR